VAPDKVRVPNDLWVVETHAGTMPSALARVVALDPGHQKACDYSYDARRRELAPVGWVRMPD